MEMKLVVLLAVVAGTGNCHMNQKTNGVRVKETGCAQEGVVYLVLSDQPHYILSLSLGWMNIEQTRREWLLSWGVPAASVYLPSGCQRTLPPELGKLRLRLTTA